MNEHLSLPRTLADIAQAAGEQSFGLGLAELWKTILEHNTAARLTFGQYEAVERWKMRTLMTVYNELVDLRDYTMSGWANLQAAALCRRAVLDVSEHGQFRPSEFMAAKRELLLAAQAAQRGRAAA